MTVARPEKRGGTCQDVVLGAFSSMSWIEMMSGLWGAEHASVYAQMRFVLYE